MLVGGGVFVGRGVEVLVGSVFVGTRVGVLVRSGMLVGTDVVVGLGLTAHPLLVRVSRPKIASHKRALRSAFCILISSHPDLCSLVVRF
jgi:hypothetical protein